MTDIQVTHPDDDSVNRDQVIQTTNGSYIAQATHGGVATVNVFQSVSPVSEDTIKAKFTAYRQRIVDETEFVSLRGIPVSAQWSEVNLPLEQVYIQLQAVDRKQQQRRIADEKVIAGQKEAQAEAPRRGNFLARMLPFIVSAHSERTPNAPTILKSE